MRLCAAKRKSAFDPRWERRAANWCKWFCARAWFRFWRGWRWERSVPRFPAICWLRCCSKCAPPTRASSRRRESRWWRSASWPTICRPVAQDAWTQLRPCEPNNDVDTTSLRIVLAQGALTIAIGVGAGLLSSAALTRFLATMLFEIAPTDAIIFCALATLLAGVAVLACLAPAMRADGINVAAARVILRGK